jgi:hypothetical protein
MLGEESVPVNLRDVTEVRNAGESVGEDLRRRLIELDMRDNLTADDRLHTHLEAAVTGERRDDARGHDTPMQM